MQVVSIMIELSPAVITVLMIGGLIAAVLLGFPLSFSLGGVALLVGMVAWGPDVVGVLYNRLYGVMSNYVLLAAPLFIAMGLMIERSGIAERLFGALYLWLGGIRGGLAVATIVLGTALAACVGIIAASVIMLGLIALPAMLERGYAKDLATGAVCAGGTLGILIPPSVMLVFYGPTAAISVGQLFMGAIVPGLLLSVLYQVYILVRAFISPSVAPAMPLSERNVPLREKTIQLITSAVPILVLIFSVLGVIFLGIATPTEAAGVGLAFTVIMAAAYKRLSFSVINAVTKESMIVTGMALFLGASAAMFTGVFLGLGCGDVVSGLILQAPFGRWGAFMVVMAIVFILGMFIDWMGIIFVIVPLATPVGLALGFDKLWFAMMIIINLQMSFLTPPFAYALFFLKGVCAPEWRVEMSDIIKGVIPFVVIIIIALVLCALFPPIITWLPSKMIT